MNLDGIFWPAVPAGGLGGRSFMLFGKQSDHAAGDAPDWDQTWADLTGYKTLKGISSPLMDGISSAYPEVVAQHA